MSTYYKGIHKLNNAERTATLKQYEKLAQEHKEYRRIVGDVASAPDQDAEIDTLLSWRYILTHDNINGVIDTETGELARYDHDTKTTRALVGYGKAEEPSGLHTTDYAGSLDENGAPQEITPSKYAQTMSDLYAEVVQLVAYTHYNIPRIYHNTNIVVPASACDEIELYKAECKQARDKENTDTYARGLDGQWHIVDNS